MPIAKLEQKERQLVLLQNQRGRMNVTRYSTTIYVSAIARIDTKIAELEEELQHNYLALQQILDGDYE